MEHEQFEDRQEEQALLLLRDAYAAVFDLALETSAKMKRLFDKSEKDGAGKHTKVIIDVIDPDSDEDYPAYLTIDLKLLHSNEHVNRDGVRVHRMEVEFAEVEPAHVPLIFEGLEPEHREILADRILPFAHALRAKSLGQNFEEMQLLDYRFELLREDMLSADLHVPRHRHD